MNPWNSVRSKTAKGGVGRGKGLYDPTPENKILLLKYNNQEEKLATPLTSPYHT